MDTAVSNVFSRIDSYQNDIIGMQRALTAIPALAPSSGGQGEWKKALKTKEFMDAIGYDEFYEINCPDDSIPDRKNHPNHVYTVYGKNREKTLWIMSHFDIVPPGEAKLWESDPYELRIEGDTLYGRGVEDNQQGMVSSMLAIKAIREEGLTPSCNISLLFISDEETGNTQGIQYILKQKPDIFKKDDIIIVPDSGSDDGSAIEVAEKSILWTKFTTRGKQTHASRPGSGINAFKAASHLVVKLGSLYAAYPEENPLFDPPMSTFEPTMKLNNVPNINSIPGEDVFYLDSRVLPAYSLDDVRKTIGTLCNEIEKEFKVSITVEFPQQSQAAPATDVDAGVVKALKAAISDVYGVKGIPTGIGGGTVAAYIRKAGFPAAVWSCLNETAHQPNEHCSIKNVKGDAKVFAHIVLKS